MCNECCGRHWVGALESLVWALHWPLLNLHEVLGVAALLFCSLAASSRSSGTGFVAGIGPRKAKSPAEAEDSWVFLHFSACRTGVGGEIRTHG
jgi:hypothetical protein